MNASQAATPIPMAVVGGYLGAGKTTLLNHVLAHGQGLRVAVLVNDFGEINVDAMLIRSRSRDVIQLENGCICCSIGNRLVDALEGIAHRSERPDLLLIEASGVSDPARIAQVGMLDRAFQLTVIVVAVDVQSLEANLANPLVGDMVRRQIDSATALVMSKCDLVDADRRQSAARQLGEAAPRATLLSARQGRIPLSVYLDRPSLMSCRPSRLFGAAPVVGSGLHQGIATFAYRGQRAFHKQRLRQTLHDLPFRLLRAKGVVRLQGVSQAQELHVVGGILRWTALAGPVAEESVLVFIGCFSPQEQAALALALDAAQY